MLSWNICWGNPLELASLWNYLAQVILYLFDIWSIHTKCEVTKPNFWDVFSVFFALDRDVTKTLIAVILKIERDDFLFRLDRPNVAETEEIKTAEGFDAKEGKKEREKNGGIIRPSVHSHFVFFRNPFFPIFCPWPLNVIIIIPDLSFSHQGNHSHHHHLLRLSLTHFFHTFSAAAMFSPSLSVMVVSLLSFSLQKRPPFFSFSFFIFIFSSFLFTFSPKTVAITLEEWTKKFSALLFPFFLSLSLTRLMAFLLFRLLAPSSAQLCPS